MIVPDKPREDFSDIQGGARSTEAPRVPGFEDLQSDARSTERASARTYVVRSGDTLSEIAERFYGRASRWRALFEANRDRIDDPDRIFPGQELRIPELDDDAF
ncbi:MAG TPA: LysM peptidoglycan-binding domain-containing protein [Lysobacter sp.]|nr:LysM peptidoglycan-binding domain-containing protein [Lysobacter sp.]